ncbi:MAG: hypothetical protein ABWZ40_09730 [Caulobacterales bacterium]
MLVRTVILGLFNHKAAGPEGAFFIGAEPWAVALAVALKKAGALARLLDPDHVRTHVARLEGADAEHLQPLGVDARQILKDVNGRYVVIAVTDGRYANMLARHYLRALPPARVLCAALHRPDPDPATRFLGQDWTGETLSDAWRGGWRFDVLTECTGKLLRAHRKAHPGSEVVARVESKGRLVIASQRQRLKPQSKSTLVMFSPPEKDRLTSEPGRFL